MSKEKTAKIIPNAVGLATAEDKHVFGSLLSRDSTFKFISGVWRKAALVNNTAVPIKKTNGIIVVETVCTS